MHKLELGGRRRLSARAVAVASAVAVGSLALAGAVAPGMAFAARSGPARQAAAAHHDDNVCHLGHGIKHVVQMTFDNIHFFRDNPNVPSDLQMMPSLLHFIENNGTWMSNNHTPLIAHTGDNILTTNTGLYGDRHGMPISNSYRSFNPDGTADPAASFAYWTDPIFDTASTPNPGHDTNPSMVYAAQPPATAKHPAGAEHHHAGAVGSLHQGRLQRRRRLHGEPGTREHRRRPAEGVRPELARGRPAERRPRLLQGR